MKTAIANYKERTGHYPERVLADQIYRNRDNILYCNEHGIRLSGKRLGRPKKDADSKAEKKIAYMDNTDRIEVERKFIPRKTQIRSGFAAYKKRRYNKSIDCSQHHCNEHRPPCGDAFALHSVFLNFRYNKAIR